MHGDAEADAALETARQAIAAGQWSMAKEAFEALLKYSRREQFDVLVAESAREWADMPVASPQEALQAIVAFETSAQAFFDWLCHDKGYARKLVDFQEVLNPAGIRRIGDFGNLPVAMEKAGWSERKIRRVMGDNWLRVLKDVWGA